MVKWESSIIDLQIWDKRNFFYGWLRTVRFQRPLGTCSLAGYLQARFDTLSMIALIAPQEESFLKFAGNRIAETDFFFKSSKVCGKKS